MSLFRTFKNEKKTADQLNDVTKLNTKASAQLKATSSSSSYDTAGEDGVGSDNWWSENRGGLSGHFGKAFCVVVSLKLQRSNGDIMASYHLLVSNFLSFLASTPAV